VEQTTSKRAGYAKVREILHAVGLRALDVAGKTAVQAAPMAVQDVMACVRAAGCGNAEDAIHIQGRSDIRRVTGNGNVPNVFVVDAFDAEGARNFVERHMDEAATDGDKPSHEATIIFLPPQLVPVGNGHELRHALSGGMLEPGECAIPIHELHANIHAGAGALSWRADTLVTGYPGMMIARWTPDGQKRDDLANRHGAGGAEKRHP
jgi:hypothetical protein